MSKHGTGRMSGAMLTVIVASCASYANAQTAMSVPTDMAVQKLAVSTSPPGTRPDSSVIRDVRRALRRVPEMDDSQIHIRAHRGVVTLTGSVPQTWQISRAANAARSVRGVISVSNRLAVREEGGEHRPRSAEPST